MGCGASRSQAKHASSPKNLNPQPISAQHLSQPIFSQPQAPSVQANHSSSLAPIASSSQLGGGSSAYPYLPPTYQNLHYDPRSNLHQDPGFLTVKLPRTQEEGPEPAILFDDERPKVSKEVIKLDNVPKYLSQNCTPNASWVYLKGDNSEQLPQDVQVLIERSYVRGDPMVFFELDGIPTEFTYGESVLVLNSKGDTTVYPAVRTALSVEPYHRITEDGSMRPFPKELQDAVKLAGGELVFLLDNKPYQIVASRNTLVDLKDGVNLKMMVMK